MKIEKLKFNIGCDMPMCSNVADFSIKADTNITDKNINICEKCMKNLYKEIGKINVPKSPTNVIKKAQYRSGKTNEE